MEIPESNSSPPDLNAAIGGVRRGRELTARLVVLLRRSAVRYGAGLEEAGLLAEEVLASISSALSALDSGEPQEPRRDSAAAGGSPPCSDHVGSEGFARKRKVRPEGVRRRVQSRRSQPYAWTKVVAEKLDDGHIWRKYGQKEIHGAKHPRCYFRCSHKYDQGCQAARQVQKSEDDPTMFVITYLGQHTCENPMASFRPDAVEPWLISFEPPERLDGGDRSDPPRLPAPFPTPVQETEEDDALSSQRSRNDSSSSSPEYQMLAELMPLEEASAPVTGISSAASDVVGDATSGFLGVNFDGESFQLEDILGLDHDDFAFVY